MKDERLIELLDEIEEATPRDAVFRQRSEIMDAVAALRAENHALREALRNLRINLIPPFLDNEDEWVSRQNEIIDAALGGDGKKGE